MCSTDTTIHTHNYTRTHNALTAGCYSIKAGLASAAQPSLVERTIFARRKDDKSQHTDPSFDLAGVEFGSALHPLHKAWALLVEQEQEGKLGAVTMNVLDRDTRNYLDLQLMWKLCVRRMGGQEALELSKRPVLLTYPLGTDVQAFARAGMCVYVCCVCSPRTLTHP
jgi:actin-related protein